MEAGLIAIIVLAIIICTIIGILIAGSRKKQEETQGIIYVYYADKDRRPSLLLEYSVPIDEITSRKRVVLDVIVIGNDSQK